MIELIKETEDRLIQRIYRFDVTNKDIVLQEYLELGRPTRRHRYQMSLTWMNRLRHFNDFKNSEMKSILTPDILTEIKDIMQKIIDKSAIKLG
jgi:hypothetical protein